MSHEHLHFSDSLKIEEELIKLHVCLFLMTKFQHFLYSLCLGTPDGNV